jgi:CRP/FNR family transcriptional regulator
VKRHDPWREFVFELLSDRLSTVMAVLEEVVFQRMDRRVASLLLDKSGRIHPVKITHQEIASELGSSREVVSRILEDFSQKGLIEVGRGIVEILDFDELNVLAVV